MRAGSRPVVPLATSALIDGYSPRAVHIDEDYVRVLVEVVDRLPPVIVERYDADYRWRASGSRFQTGGAKRVSLGRVYELADECRKRARAWEEMASMLERRARTRASRDT